MKGTEETLDTGSLLFFFFSGKQGYYYSYKLYSYNGLSMRIILKLEKWHWYNQFSNYHCFIYNTEETEMYFGISYNWLHTFSFKISSSIV